jgi:RNA 3'-terminal phosphate cyclase (ATP)
MSEDVVSIDGSLGEGGGQILRTSLALSLCLGRPFQIRGVRSGRKRPGLMRQHLTAVQAAGAVAGARIKGDTIGSQEVVFEPGLLRPGEYRFSVGTAGSATLVLQTVLPALLTANAPSRLILEGGTHNPFAPPFEFIGQVFLPIINRMGPKTVATLEQPGFYPAGGGRFSVTIEPTPYLRPIQIFDRGEVRTKTATALIAKLPIGVAEREMWVLERKLGWPESCRRIVECADSAGPGNIFLLHVESEHCAAMFTGFGRLGVRAEAVAEHAIQQARRYIGSGAALDAHMTDQVLLPLALAGGGGFSSVGLSKHTTTNLEVIRRFMPIEITTVEERQGARTVVTIGRTSGTTEVPPSEAAGADSSPGG